MGHREQRNGVKERDDTERRTDAFTSVAASECGEVLGMRQRAGIGVDLMVNHGHVEMIEYHVLM